MFEIENCYKIIFEAMLEESVFQSIAQRMQQYTGAGIAFVTGAGKVLACSCQWARLFPGSANKDHLIFEDYTAIFEKKECGGRYQCITPVYGGKRTIGYVVLMYENTKEREAIQELGGILAQNVRLYFEEEQKQYRINQSLKEHMVGWMLFEETISIPEEKQSCRDGKYILVRMDKENEKAGEMAARLYGIWNWIHTYEGKTEIFALLYRLREQDIQSVYTTIEAEKREYCVSEVFSKLCLCRDKKNILRRMSQVKAYQEMHAMRREKEWSMWGMYTYTDWLIKKAGLRDYSVEQLILEDEKNHTELYHTLRSYLLCGNNVTMASKMLHIHRNTLIYRLKQIREYMGMDVNDNEVSRELLAFIMMNDIAGRSVRSKTDDED